MADRVTVTEARRGFAAILDRVAHDGQRIRLARRGQDMVAIVPISDVLMLEAIEDELDLTAAHEALAAADGQARIPWAEAPRQTGTLNGIGDRWRAIEGSCRIELLAR
jgi:prevent-host-death family protein